MQLTMHHTSATIDVYKRQAEGHTGDEAAQGHGQARQQGVEEGFGAAFSGYIDGHGDGDALWNGVHGNGDRHGDAQRRIIPGGEVEGGSLGDIVEGKAQ